MALIGRDAIEIEPVETENIGSWAGLVMSELPGCDDLMVRQKLGYALREFCRETDACTVAHTYSRTDCEEMPNGIVRVALGAPSGMVVGAVLDVRCGERSVAPYTASEGGITAVFLASHECCGDDIEVRYSLYPKAGGEACPKWFKERYAEAVAAGAMYHLLSMTGKAWSDAQRAGTYLAEYQNAVAEAAYRRIAGNGPVDAVPADGGYFM